MGGKGGERDLPLDNMRVGLGYDIHPLVRDRRLVIGGVVVPSTVGAKGHSDGDVLYHALGDALLGAAALGDIGILFSDTNPKWKDASSSLFIKEIYRLVKRRGFEANNIDANIHLESPKLTEFIPRMIKNICLLLGLGERQVNIKAKRGEGMDAVGRGEAIVAQVVVLLS